MAASNPLEQLLSGEWLSGLLPDFVIGFALFFSLTYAVVSRRMGAQRPAVLVAAALGAALATGLVWWERDSGVSIRNLGPIAAGFGLIVLAGVIHQSIRHVGGNWAGAGISVGATLLVGWVAGIRWPIPAEMFQTLAGVALTVGMLAFMLHRRGALSLTGSAESAAIRHDMSDLEQDRSLSRRLTRGFHRLRREAHDLPDHPEVSDDMLTRIRRMLPAEGWLTQRMAGLRAKAVLIRQGHISRIEELRRHMSKLDPAQQAERARQLQQRYAQLRLDDRIESLDRLVAGHEQALRTLLQQAAAEIGQGNPSEVERALRDAERLQKRCTRLFQLIERTERKLIGTSARVRDSRREANRP